MKKRKTYHKFTDEVPDKKIIESIIEEATYITPVKNDVYCFKSKVYGPEWSKEKFELYTHSACVDEWIKSSEIGQEFLDLYTPHTKNYPDPKIERLAQSHIDENNVEQVRKRMKQFPRTLENQIQFNEQLLAPYLFAFYITKPWNHHHLKMKEGADHTNSKGGRPLIAISMFAYSIALIAEEKGLNSGFCGCFDKPHYPTAIFDNLVEDKDSLLNSKYDGNGDTLIAETMPFFLGIGYGKHKSSRPTAKPKPEILTAFA